MAFLAAFVEPPRPYAVRMRRFSADLSDKQLKKRTRLTRFQFDYLLENIEHLLENNSGSSLSVEPDPKLLAVLRFLATGEFQWSVGDSNALCQASLSRFIGQVVEAIITLAPQHISMPETPADMMATAETFPNFPKLIGCVDGTLIPIEAPRENEVVYVDRKGNHSLNCQLVCDGNLKILNAVAMWPGSTHDSFVFRECALKARFEQGNYGDYKLIGDRGYRLETYLLTIFRNAVLPEEIRFNELLCSTRSAIERCIGLLKGRWRCLHRTGGELIYTPEKVCRLFIACCVLHNICFLRNGDGDSSDDTEGSSDEDDADDPNDSDADSDITEDSDVSTDEEEDQEDENQAQGGVGGRPPGHHAEAVRQRNAFLARHQIFHV